MNHLIIQSPLKNYALKVGDQATAFIGSSIPKATKRLCGTIVEIGTTRTTLLLSNGNQFSSDNHKIY